LRALEGELTTLEGKTIDYRGVKGNEKNTGKHHSFTFFKIRSKNFYLFVASRTASYRCLLMM
jgi:hypothetical protein